MLQNRVNAVVDGGLQRGVLALEVDKFHFASLREETFSEIPKRSEGSLAPREFKGLNLECRAQPCVRLPRESNQHPSSALMSMKADRDPSLRSGFQKKVWTDSAKCNRLFNWQDNRTTSVSSALMSMKADRDPSLRSGFQKKASATRRPRARAVVHFPPYTVVTFPVVS